MFTQLEERTEDNNDSEEESIFIRGPLPCHNNNVFIFIILST